jgi:hypothetical protein
MRSPPRGIGLVLVLATTALGGIAVAGGRTSLKVVEGTVLEVGVQPGEGDLELVTVRLSAERPEPRELELLLAPRSVLEETGFTVRQGDRLKARVFTAGEGPASVHKVLNLTQSSMVRLRTLHKVPLWDGAGLWQGGPRPGGRAGHHRPKPGHHGGSGPPHR